MPAQAVALLKPGYFKVDKPYQDSISPQKNLINLAEPLKEKSGVLMGRSRELDPA